MPERCGAKFRKPVENISDRAKRYRAHSEGCRPKGPKVCFKCGSRRFITIDHADGDESNGRPSNLRWACKSHNTILGKKMAKAGKGVRTRQYNPDVELCRMPACKRAALDGEWYCRQHMPKSRSAIRQYREQQRLDRSPFPKKKNPGATNLAQYVQAAVDHSRGSHDAGGKVIHETPKAKRREFAREIAFRKRHNPGEADALYRKFHGRGPDKITTMLVAGVDPYGGHPELTSLGPLIRLVVGEGVEMNEDGTVKDEGEWVNEICFVPMAEYRRRIERLNTKDSAEVRQFKAWLKSAGAPDVAAVPNTRQLYFVGGKQALDDSMLASLGSDPEKDLADLGFCYLIEYVAQKRFDKFEVMTYYHAFGEKTGVQPRLIYRAPQRMLELVGGEYEVKSVGIDN